MRTFCLVVSLVMALSSCAWLEEEPTAGQIVRPDEPNVLKYISTEKARLYRHKISPSLYQHGVPSYSLRNGGNVEVVVQFDSRINLDYAQRLVEPWGGRARDEISEGIVVIIPEKYFWELVMQEHVEFVTIKKAPQRLQG